MNAKISNLDHTADAGVEIFADSLNDLFRASAKSMYKVIECPLNLPSAGHKKIEMTEDQLDVLLVSFLNELNYYITTHYLLLDPIVRLTVKKRKQSYWLECEAQAKHIDPELMQDLVELKAVTYHQLEIEQKNDGYHTKIIFDL